MGQTLGLCAREGYFEVESRNNFGIRHTRFELASVECMRTDLQAERGERGGFALSNRPGQLGPGQHVSAGHPADVLLLRLPL